MKSVKDDDEIITVQIDEKQVETKNTQPDRGHQQKPRHRQNDSNPPSNSSDDSIPSMLSRSKPGRKTDQEREDAHYQRREWSDDEITELIRLWKTNDILYNTQHPLYYVQTERKKAMDCLADELGIHLKDVNDKMHSLRTYYCSQRQRTETSSNGLLSRWKFYNQMSFLYESVTNRANKNNSGRPGRKRYRLHDDDEYTMSRPVSQVHTYQMHHSPIYDDFSQQRIPQEEMSPNFIVSRADNSMQKDVKGLQVEIDESSNLSNSDGRLARGNLPLNVKHTADEMFLQMVASQLSQVSEGQEKEKLKLDIQTMIFNTRFKTHSK